MKSFAAVWLMLCLAFALPALAEEPAIVSGWITEEAPSVTVSVPAGGADGYIRQELYGLKPNARNIGGRLTGGTARLYAQLLSRVRLVAAGEEENTAFTIPLEQVMPQTTFTAEELGVAALVSGGAFTAETRAAVSAKLDEIDPAKAVHALMADCPYELYWMNKGEDVTIPSARSYRLSGTSAAVTVSGTWTTSIPVAEAYAAAGPDGAPEPFVCDKAYGESVQQAAANAQAIVAGCAGQDDRTKLHTYLTEICDRTSYDYDATEEGVPYGSPWQLVWALDDSAGTKVVCEGYAKAFQYLCDLSTFTSGISVIPPAGFMRIGTMTERHMWNLVGIGAANYLVDVTNCDGDSVGAPDGLFMRGCSGGTAESGYVYRTGRGTVVYLYDDTTIGVYRENELILAGADAESVLDCGALGDSLLWFAAEENGLTALHIAGSGPMPDIAAGEAPWAAYAEDIARIFVEDGVTRVGMGLVRGASLTMLRLPASLAVIGEGAMAEAPDGLELRYGGSRESWPAVSIGAADSAVLAGLRRINLTMSPPALQLPDGLTGIGEEALAGLNADVIRLPDSLTALGDRALAGCGLLEQLYIPGSVVSVGEDVLAGCSDMLVIYGPAGSAAEALAAEEGLAFAPAD